MKIAEKFETVSETLQWLKQEGYSEDFNVKGDYIFSDKTKSTLSPEEFVIDETFRFEGESDPADEMIIYAISSKHGIKGTLVDAFGMNSDPGVARLVSKLKRK